MKARTLLPLAALAAASSLGAPAPAHAALRKLDDLGDAITAIEIERAHALLADLDANDPKVALEKARLAMYEGDCDTAAATLVPALRKADEREFDWLQPLSMTCMRAVAGTVVVEDAARGVRVRLQDDDDRALVPLLADTIERQRAVLERDLGVKMPRPTRIDLVRDQLSLSAMTGLGWEAAINTGTVAIAKFGRVIMVSPRAVPDGYAFRDTLAHEFTHLALSRGTLDRAPLWLQEGVAKREETRWRKPTVTDLAMAPDPIAAVGLSKGLGLPLDGLGPSLAMLPSALQATVCYAEVNSFVEFIAGDRAADAGAPRDSTVLPKLVAALAKTKETDADKVVDAALKETTGRDLKQWDSVWRPWVAGKVGPTPAGLGLESYRAPPAPDGPDGKKTPQKPAPPPPHRDASLGRALRLGELLLERGHARAARTKLEPVALATPTDPHVVALTARARLALGDATAARTLVGGELKRGIVDGDLGAWWAVRAEVLAKLGEPFAAIDEAFSLAIGHDPLGKTTACGWSAWAATASGTGGELGPSLGDVARGLCETAKHQPTAALSKD